MKKFTESNSTNDIFDRVENLKQFLIDYDDAFINYKIEYHIQKYYDGFYAVKTSELSFEDIAKSHNLDEYTKCYIITFDKTFDTLTSDKQRTGKGFGVPTENTFKLFEVTDEVKFKLEKFGYKLLISMVDGVFSIMIMNKSKHE